MNKYTIHCTEEQTKKALNLGAPLEINEGKNTVLCRCQNYHTYKRCVIPTAEQMIGWLEEQGLCIDSKGSWSGQITMWAWDNTKRKHIRTFNSKSRQEATLVVIDAALDYLIKNKK